MAAVNHRARAHKQQRLEERMRDQVEHADSHAAHPQPRHHVAKLRHGRVGQNALDVVLRNCNQRSKNRGECTHPSDDGQRRRRPTRQRARMHERKNARNQIHARRHHRRRVNQRRHRRRTFHRIRQPHVQRKLSALPHSPCKNQQSNRTRSGQSPRGMLRQQSTQRRRFH